MSTITISQPEWASIQTQLAVKRCLFHRWGPGEWIANIAAPVFRYTCRRCGAVRYRQFGAD